MKANRFVKRGVAEAALFFLFAAPGLTRAQSPVPTPVEPQTPRKAPPLVLPKKRLPSPMDDFAGLTYTADQKTKIRQIHQDIKKRMDTVAKDNKLSPEQKGAMLQGYQHMERGQVYRVLTGDQQKEVRKKALARRAAAMQEMERQKETEKQLSLPAPRP